MQKDITALKQITFSNIHSVQLYLNSALTWGNISITFQDILSTHDFGYGATGSVVVYGEVEYCQNPCQNLSSQAGQRCNTCNPHSTLSLGFTRYWPGISDPCVMLCMY